MNTYSEKAWAKINLSLDVLGIRPDGYHDLQSIMQTVSLCDDVTVTVGTGKAWMLRCDRDDIPADQRNLAWKAAQVYCKKLNKDPGGLLITIEKRIPSGAGMGGGSADAAAVLRILNRHYGLPLTVFELAELGAEVGSDVPFCVVGGTVMCEGRGERLRPICAMPDCNIVICKPEFSVSTPALYRKLDLFPIKDRPDNTAMEQHLLNGNLQSVAEGVCNVFEPVVAEDHPEIGHIKETCFRHGALGTQMTGSGSAVFAIMPDRNTALSAVSELEKIYSVTCLAAPV